MPRIDEPNFQSNVQGPVGQEKANAGDFGSGAAWEKFGESTTTAGALLQRRQQQIEVSDLNASLSGLHAEAQKDWDQSLSTAKPGDQSFADDFMERLDNKLSEAGENISTRVGQQYFNDAAAKMREHFAQRSNLGQANLASRHAVNNATQAHNQRSADLIQNPDSFDVQNGQEQDALDAMWASGSFRGNKDVYEKLKKDFSADLAVNAIRGWIEDDPNDAKDQLQNGEWNDILGGDGVHKMLGEANAGIRAQKIDGNNQRIADKLAEHDKWEKINQTVLESFVNKNLTAKDVLALDLPTEGPLGKNYWINKIEQQNTNQGKMPRDHSIYTNVLHQILLPQDDPSRVKNAADIYKIVDHGIDANDASQLINVLNGRHTPDGEDEARMKKTLLDTTKKMFGEIDQFGVFKDPYAGLAYQGFESAFLDEYKKQKEKGVYFRDLLSQKSKSYLGDMYQDYLRTPVQVQQDILNRRKGIAPQKKEGLTPRTPGESVDNYIKRTTGGP